MNEIVSNSNDRSGLYAVRKKEKRVDSALSRRCALALTPLGRVVGETAN